MYDRGLWRYIRFFENPVDFINSPVYRDGCEFSVIFPENPVGLAGMQWLSTVRSCQFLTSCLPSSTTPCPHHIGPRCAGDDTRSVFAQAHLEKDESSKLS